MAIFTTDKEITPMAWREFGNEGIFTMNPWHGDHKEQFENFKSNIYIIDQVKQFSYFFKTRNVGKNKPTNTNENWAVFVAMKV